MIANRNELCWYARHETVDVFRKACFVRKLTTASQYNFYVKGITVDFLKGSVFAEKIWIQGDTRSLYRAHSTNIFTAHWTSFIKEEHHHFALITSRSKHLFCLLFGVIDLILHESWLIIDWNATAIKLFHFWNWLQEFFITWFSDSFESSINKLTSNRD